MQPWAHLWRRYRKLWTRSGCPSDKSDASFDSPFPSTPSAADPVASTSIAFIVYVTTVPIASTSPPADGLRRSFVDVVTMSGPPQRPPPVGAIAAGHVRSPFRQPTPPLPGAGIAGSAGGMAGVSASFGAACGTTLRILYVFLGASLFSLSVFFCFVCCSKRLDPSIFSFGEDALRFSLPRTL
jgi:hypothetical protein